MRFLTIIFLLVGTLSIQAQNINRVEYFIDNDPGFGNGTLVTGYTPAATLNFSFNVGLNGVPAGLHHLFIRARDVNGHWSQALMRRFIIENITPTPAAANVVAAEYFIDNDPGFGSGTPISITPGATMTKSFTADLTTVGAGIHHIFVRVRDANGHWSQVLMRRFIIENITPTPAMPNLMEAEYFINNDPGIGNGISIPLNPSATSQTLGFIADLTNLPSGIHYINLRVRDANGTWGQVVTRKFMIENIPVFTPKPNIVAAEYFFDNDPGFGNGTAVSVVNLDSVVNLAFSADLSTLATGQHTFFVRALDENGVWSPIYSSTVNEIVANGCNIVWTNPVNVSLNSGGDLITKTVNTTAYDAGIHSQDVLAAGQDGWISMKVIETNTRRVFGLAQPNTSVHFNTINFGIRLQENGIAQVVENGAVMAGLGNYSTNDEFEIRRTGTAITYYRNGALVYSSGGSSSTDLIADGSIYSLNGTIYRAYKSFGCSGCGSLVVNAGADQTFCETDPAVNLVATPSGGTWSGAGVSGSTFNPATAGVGTHTLTYNFVSVAGCTGSDTKVVSVVAVQAANAGTDVSVCRLSTTTFTGTPSGGTWSGTGVTTAGVFTASSTGTFTLTYTHTNANGCVSSDTKVVTVNPLPSVNAGVDMAVCISDPSMSLTGTPSGGTWSGAGVSGNTFDPATAGVGVHTLTYTYTNANGCTNSDAKLVTVVNMPTIDAGADMTICSGASSFSLGGSPSGGTWSGAGVSGSTFNPATAGVGTHTLTYTYAAGGCSGMDTKVVTVLASPVVNAGIDQTVCADNPNFSVQSGASPSGGTWSGTGVTSGGLFRPSVAGVGTHVLTYTVSNGSCTISDTKTVIVLPLPTVNAGANMTVCINGAIPLTGTPSGGTWSGAGVSGSIFDPSVAGVGVHTLTYTYADANGCTNSATKTITVYSLPTVSAGQNVTICKDGGILQLVGTPAGGTWSGTGVSGNTFDPLVGGVDTYFLTYTYTDANGCTGLDLKIVTVVDAILTSAGQDLSVCKNAAPFALVGSPSGGTWTGVGIAAGSNVFNPAASGTGTFQIIYTVSNAYCSISDTMYVTVNPTPFVGLTNQTICRGDSILLYASMYHASWYKIPDVTPFYVDNSGLGNPRYQSFVQTQIIRVELYDPTTGCYGYDTMVVNVQTCQPGCQPTWIDHGGVSIGDTITKTVAGNNWNSAWGISTNVLQGDGTLYFSTLESNRTKAMGLSNLNFNQSINSIAHAFRLNANGTVEVFEMGTSLGSFGTYQAGDEFIIQRSGAQIFYWHNGNLLLTTAAMAGNLHVDFSMFTPSSTFYNILVDFGCTPTVFVPTVITPNIFQGGSVTIIPNIYPVLSYPNTFITMYFSQSGGGGGPIIVGGDDTISVEMVSNPVNPCDTDIVLIPWKTIHDEVGIDSGTIEITLYPVPSGGFTPATTGCGGNFVPECPNFVVVSWYDSFGNSGNGNTYAANAPTNGTVTFVVKNTAAPIGVDTAHLTFAVAQCPPDECHALWRDATNVTIVNTTVQKNGISNFWDAGVGSVAALQANQDGVISTTILETNTDRMFGFAPMNQTTGINDLSFAFQFKINGAYRIFESGSDRGGFGSYSNNDLFEIERVGGVVTYYQNGTPVYTSTVVSNAELFLDGIIRTPNGTIHSVQHDFACNQPCDLELTLVSKTDESCTGNDGSINIQANLSGVFYRWLDNPTLTSAMRNNLSAGTYTIVAYFPATNCTDSLTVIIGDGCTLCPVVWTEERRVETNGDTLTKVNNQNSWNASAISASSLAAGDDGMVQTTIIETNTERIFGLGDFNPNSNINLIDYGIRFLSNGKVRIQEEGVSKGIFGTYTTGDVFGIQRQGTSILYQRNGSTIYTSTVASTSDLWLDVSLRTPNATLFNVEQSWACEPCNLQITPVITVDPTCYGDDGVIIINSNSPNVVYQAFINNDPTPVPLDSVDLDNGFGEFLIIGHSTGGLYGSCADTVPAYLDDGCFDLCTPSVSTDNAVSVNGGDVTKTGSNFWNGFAIFSDVLPSIDDGLVRTTIIETNTERSFGLSDPATTTGSLSDLSYGIRLLSDGTFIVVENNTTVANGFDYHAGDVFTITRVFGAVSYKQNSQTFYVSSTYSTTDLAIQANLKTPGATIASVETDFNCTGTLRAGQPTTTNQTTAFARPSDRFAAGSIGVFPNPTNGQTTLELDFETPENVQIEVLSATGQRLISEKLNNIQQINHLIDLSNQPDGLYLIQVRAGSKMTTQKVLRVH